MRYFIFILFVFCNSCSTRKPLVQESNSTPKENVVAATKSAVDSVTSTHATVNESAQVSVANLSPTYGYNVSGLGPIMSYPYSGQYDHSQLFFITTAMVSPIAVDSTSLQPVDTSAETKSVAPIKVIFPKPSATILPETKFSLTRYIIPGIATAFLITFFFFVAKRRKKNIVRD